MNYLDKTFCPFHKECGNGHECHRAFTEKVKSDARQWWGSDDYPIALFVDKPECYEP